MNFNTPQYAVLLSVVLWAYWASSRLRTRHFILLAASYVFYGAWNPKYLLLIVGSTLLDFHVGRALARVKSQRYRRLLLAASLVGNLGALGLFKYFNFFVGEISHVAALLGIQWAAPELKLLLPVGISFYTFQTLSYTIDVYRCRLEPTDNLLEFATFVAFFPQLVAGPILRAEQFLPQLATRQKPDEPLAMDGVHRILRGLLKKAIFADLVGAFVVDHVFANPGAWSSLDAMIATYAYALQIYADFSAYSDIAIGSAQLLGYRIPENFNYPYLSRDPRELWHRWHISLSSWLRDYLYIPLGGSRCSNARTYFNLMATMVLGGLWHGAGMTFIVWGTLHGVVLAFTRWIQRHFPHFDDPHRPAWDNVLRIFITFHFVCLTWIFFRSPDFATAGAMLSTIGRGDFSLGISLPRVALVAVGLAIHFGNGPWKNRIVHTFLTLPRFVQAVIAVGVICVVAAAAQVAAPFIYFQF